MMKLHLPAGSNKPPEPAKPKKPVKPKKPALYWVLSLCWFQIGCHGLLLITGHYDDSITSFWGWVIGFLGGAMMDVLLGLIWDSLPKKPAKTPPVKPPDQTLPPGQPGT